MTEDLVKRLRIRAEFTGPYSALWDEAADRIEKLESELTHIWAWYPVNVSKPHETIDVIKDYAFAALKGEKKNDPST